MNKIKISLITALILGLLPLVGFAQFDFDINSLFDTYDPNPSPNSIVTDFYLIWSANTYVPYEYQGRALASQGSEVTIEAIVSLSSGRADNLNYNWFIDGIFQENKSGYGKNTLSFSVLQHPGGYHVVKGQISNEDKSIFEERSTKIPVVEPELVVYSGFSDQASKTSLVSAEKISSFTAKPYFFGIKKIIDLEFEWHFTGQEPIISSEYDASVLNLSISEKEDKEVLENSLWVSVKNKTEAKQSAYQTIKIQIY